MVPLVDLLERHYFALNLRIADEKTRAQYRFALANLAEALGKTPTLSDLTDDNVTRMMIHLRDVRKLHPRTINDRRSRINALWSWLSAKEFLSRRPTTCPLPVPAKMPTAWTRDELNRLIQACREAPGSIGLIPASCWWLAFHGIAWDTAARPGEILAMRWEWLEWQTGWLSVPSTVRKGKLKPARYRLQPDAIAALRVIAQPSGLILPWPYHPSYLWAKYRSLLISAGLPASRDCMPHRMRRSHASWLSSAGFDASISLGHGNPETTRTHYLDPRISSPAPSGMLPFRLLSDMP